MKIITFFNNKGGVGKTTTVVNLASYLQKMMNKRILLMDLDPQSNSTQAILPQEKWIEYYDPDRSNSKKTVFDCFKSIRNGDSGVDKISIPIKPDENNYGIWMIPGHPQMSIIDEEMSRSWQQTISADRGSVRKLNWLGQFKKYYNDDFDYLFIDVGPSLGALNRSALLNSDYFFTPMASDIFSLWGVANIGEWIDGWMLLYQRIINDFSAIERSTAADVESFFKQNNININVEKYTRYIGYSVQQYSKRKFKTGERATAAYEKVIAEFPDRIIGSLKKFIKKELSTDDLKVGDVPYVYSVIPLSQTANRPIFDLTYSDGLRGNQRVSVDKYREHLNNMAVNIIRNIEK